MKSWRSQTIATQLRHITKMPQFTEGDFVFAKIRGYRHWPGKIMEVLEPMKSNTTKYNVSFFGDNTVAEVKDSKVFPYKENVHKYGIPLTKDGINKTFNKALSDAEAALEATIVAKRAIEPSEKQTEFSDQSVFSLELNNSNHISTSDLNNTLENIQAKILNTNNTDLETITILAAEAGNALLIENNNLKQELYSLKLTNSNLAQMINKQNNTDKVKYQVTIEELENKNVSLINRIETLNETIGQIEKQLVKEKMLRDELTLTFENYEKNQSDMIKEYQLKINEQSNIIASLERLREKHNEENIKELSDCWIQTDPQPETNIPDTNPLPILSPNSYLLTELTQLKLRQDKMEYLIENMETQSGTHYSGSLDNTFKIAKCSKPNQTINSFGKVRNAKNFFSISLKASKYRDECQNRTEKIPQSGLGVNLSGKHQETKKASIPQNKTSSYQDCKRNIFRETKTNNFVKRKPPMNAVNRPEDQTIEDFYGQYIEHFINLNQDPQTMEKTPGPIYSPKEDITIQNNNCFFRGDSKSQN
ncbi:PC4 and SFRS1-interacting protein [Homalodisca vitripennis]|nr:PC4 and SFRS1-interacting protein [Homalodisca vitripennis]